MSDLFSNGNIVPMVEACAPAKMSAERSIEAYRNNIAPPDIHIADRTQDYTAVVVGEDGKPLTQERRQQLMQESGAKPMFTPDGKATGNVYLGTFDAVIEPEKLGESAIRNRPGYRVVQPRELELENLDIDDSTLESASGSVVIPAAGGQGQREISAGGSTGCLSVIYVGAYPGAARVAESIGQAVRQIVSHTGHSATRLRCHSDLAELVDTLQSDERYGLRGLLVHLSDDQGIRVLGDPAYTSAYVQIRLEQTPKEAEEQ